MNGLEPGAGNPDVAPKNAEGKRRGRWWVHLVVIGSYPVAIGLLGWNRPISGPALTHTSQGLVITCFVHLAIFSVIFVLGWLASRASGDDLLLRWRGGFWPIPIGVGYSVALRLALGFIAVFVFSALVVARLITPQEVQEFARANRPNVSALVDISAMRRDPLYFWLTITLVSFVVAGLREEFWRSAVLAAFRALWPQRFGSRPGQIVAAAVVSLVFGLGHVSLGVIGVAAATLLGLGLGVIMVLHRSIWPAVIAHGMFDATTFALLPWAMEKFREV